MDAVLLVTDHSAVDYELVARHASTRRRHPRGLPRSFDRRHRQSVRRHTEMPSLTLGRLKLELVTGGAGFIGSHLVDALLRDGVRVFGSWTISRPGARENLAHRRTRRDASRAIFATRRPAAAPAGHRRRFPPSGARVHAPFAGGPGHDHRDQRVRHRQRFRGGARGEGAGAWSTRLLRASTATRRRCRSGRGRRGSPSRPMPLPK